MRELTGSLSALSHLAHEAALKHQAAAKSADGFGKRLDFGAHALAGFGHALLAGAHIHKSHQAAVEASSRAALAKAAADERWAATQKKWADQLKQQKGRDAAPEQFRNDQRANWSARAGGAGNVGGGRGPTPVKAPTAIPVAMPIARRRPVLMASPVESGMAEAAEANRRRRRGAETAAAGRRMAGTFDLPGLMSAKAEAEFLKNQNRLPNGLKAGPSASKGYKLKFDALEARRVKDIQRAERQAPVTNQPPGYSMLKHQHTPGFRTVVRARVAGQNNQWSERTPLGLDPPPPGMREVPYKFAREPPGRPGGGLPPGAAKKAGGLPSKASKVSKGVGGLLSEAFKGAGNLFSGLTKGLGSVGKLAGPAGVALLAVGVAAQVAAKAVQVGIGILSYAAQKASPQAWNTLTKSFDLLAATAGQQLVPGMMRMAAWLQRTAVEAQMGVGFGGQLNSLLGDLATGMAAMATVVTATISVFADLCDVFKAMNPAATMAVKGLAPASPAGKPFGGHAAEANEPKSWLGKAWDFAGDAMGKFARFGAFGVEGMVAAKIGGWGKTDADRQNDKRVRLGTLERLAADTKMAQPRFSAVEQVWEQAALGFLSESDLDRQMMQKQIDAMEVMKQELMLLRQELAGKEAAPRK